MDTQPSQSGLTITQVPLDTLVPDPANARVHGERNMQTITASLQRFGQVEPLVVQASTKQVIGGNGRLEAMKALGWTKADIVEVDVSAAEATALAIALNRSAELAQWNTETLATLLQSMQPETRAAVGFDADDLQSILHEDGHAASDDGGDVRYTQKLCSPVYEPTGDQPQIAELYSVTKRDQLRSSIMQADIEEDLRQFLLSAAERHTEFRFDRIAEFYAHAEPQVQRLMEDSVLVIIDSNAAIEAGFFQLHRSIREQLEAEHPDA